MGLANATRENKARLAGVLPLTTHTCLRIAIEESAYSSMRAPRFMLTKKSPASEVCSQEICLPPVAVLRELRTRLNMLSMERSGIARC